MELCKNKKIIINENICCGCSLEVSTVNPLYTDTRYTDKIRYNDNLNVTKHLLKR